MFGFDNRRMLDTIRRLHRRKNKITLYKFINKIHPSQMVNVYRHLHPTERTSIFQYIIRMDGVGEFIKELDNSLIKDLLHSIDDIQIKTILNKMNSEDIAELIQELNPNEAFKVEKLLNQKERSEIKEVLQYDDESAGRMMTHEFMAFDSQLTVKQSRNRFKQDAENIEMPFYIYVIDFETNKMIGITSLRQLLLNSDDKTLYDIMEKDFIYVKPTDDQEIVAQTMSEYN